MSVRNAKTGVLVGLVAALAGLFLLLRGGADETPSQGTAAADQNGSAANSPTEAEPTEAPEPPPAARANPGPGTADTPRPTLAAAQGEAGDARAPSMPADGSSRISFKALEVIEVASELVDECLELAAKRKPDLRGRLFVMVEILTVEGVGNRIVKAELDADKTTIDDKELIECATENVFAAEDVLEKLQEMGDQTAGSITLQMDKRYPLPPKKPDTWPSPDSSPECPEGTALRGERGKSQWCERPNGTKHGPQFAWDQEKNFIHFIQEWTDGTSEVGRFSTGPSKK